MIYARSVIINQEMIREKTFVLTISFIQLRSFTLT